MYCEREQNDGTVGRVPDAVCDRELFEIKPTETRTCGVECADYRWDYEFWGDCSSKCGPGQQTRTVTCIKETLTRGGKLSRRVALKECEDRLPSPVTTQPCDPPNRCRYNITVWGTCSATCDVGTQIRTASCFKEKQANGQTQIEVVSLDDCARDPTLSDPITERTCYQPCPCEIPRWVVGRYSECPVSCGGGYDQTRSVYCQCTLRGRAQVTSDSDCAGQDRPADRRPCGQAVCPCVGHHWVKGSYGDCSLTCGGFEQIGTRERKVECICYLNAERTVANETRCDQRSKPLTKIDCYPPVCPCPDPVWVTGPYDTCSKPCNGIQTRVVTCQCNHDNRTLDDGVCIRRVVDPKPPVVQRCDDDCVCRNYDYSISDWSYCSVSCGEGVQSRNVKCYCEKENVYEDVQDKTLCEDQTGRKYPDEERKCYIPCPCNYQYVVGEWSDCDPNSCIGYRNRTVSCECDGYPADIRYCDYQHIRRPDERRKCNDCPYTWVPRTWSLVRHDDICIQCT